MWRKRYDLWRYFMKTYNEFKPIIGYMRQHGVDFHALETDNGIVPICFEGPDKLYVFDANGKPVVRIRKGRIPHDAVGIVEKLNKLGYEFHAVKTKAGLILIHFENDGCVTFYDSECNMIDAIIPMEVYRYEA